MNERSERNLVGVNPTLAKVVRRADELAAAEGVSFIVTEGLRTKERQKQLMAAGATRTLNSRHLTGHAIDLATLVDGEVRWDWPLYDRLSHLMKRAADELHVYIVWGGDWVSFKDGPHFELNSKMYPG